ncbi:hypothetical protein RB601_006273 [Gaeumannomyces tritici]
MVLLRSAASAVLLLAAGVTQAATAWTFDDASVSVSAKKGGDPVKEKLSAMSPLSKSLRLGSADSLKVILTTKDGGKAKRPHQAFVLLQEPETGLEAPFPFTVKENGKAVVQIAHKDVPQQLLKSSKPVRASIVIGSFGSAQGVVAPVFEVELAQDAAVPAAEADAPVRYAKKPKIHHVFRDDPRSPPKIVSLVFAAAVAATVPILFISWSLLGANLNHLQKALGASPVSHATFFGSILAMEGIFFLYYSGWTLFQVLPLIGVVSAVTFLSGKNALGEVQSRRLAGER